MKTKMRWAGGARPWLLVCLGLGALGCADAPKARVPGPACSTCVSGGVVELENRVHWPFELASLEVALDAAKDWEKLPTDEAHVVHALPLARGRRYQLGLIANIDVPSGDERSCRVTLRFSRAVEVDALPAALRGEIYLRDPTVPFGARPELAVAFENMHSVPNLARASTPYDSECRELEAVEKALCRAKLAVADAKKRRDVPRERCTEDVKRRITEVVVEIDALRVARTMASEPGVRGDPAREALLTKSVETLSESLEGCSTDPTRSKPIEARPVETRQSSPECSEAELYEHFERNRSDRQRRGPLSDPRAKGTRW